MKYYYNETENSFAVTANFEYDIVPEGYVEITKEQYEEMRIQVSRILKKLVNDLPDPDIEEV